ncbi:MAG: radical SAM protein [Thermoanaerobaculia bacterium]
MSEQLPSDQLRTVYGPVPSRRFGNSLGIDLIYSTSACSFRCVYCQLGRIQSATMERQKFVDTSRVVHDFEESNWRAAERVTFSGSGEPTLASNLGEVISKLRQRSKKTMLVLTNGSLLQNPTVRSELALADEVACKIDAADEATFSRIHRAVDDLDLAGVIAGLRLFRKEFEGRLIIQTMLLPVNSGKMEEIARLIGSLGADEVHLTVPIRPAPREWTLATRGDRQIMSDTGSFRIPPAAQVVAIAREMERSSGVRVRPFTDSADA